MADAQYVIDIAAEMPAGAATIKQLDDLTAQLQGGGKSADFFQQAIVRSSEALDASRVVALAANAALSEGQIEYKRLERAALQASKAAERAAIKNEGVVPEDLASRALATSSAVDKYAESLRDVEKNSLKASAAETKHAKTLTNVRKLSGAVDASFARNSDQLSKLQGSLGSVGGPLGRLGSGLVAPVKGFSELSEVVGKSRAALILGVVGVGIFAAAIVVLTAVVVAATLALTAWAISLADSARTTDLSRQAVEAINPEVKALRRQFVLLQDDTGLASDALLDLTKKLQDAKVSAAELPAALRAAALAEAALGTGGASEFIKQIKEGKLTVDSFALNAQQKFGGIVEKQMLSLGAQTERLKRNLGELFGGLQIDPVLEGMRILTALFDQSTSSGAAMKFLFESIFQPLIDQATNAALVVEAFVLGFLIGMTKVFIAVKPALRAIADFFGFEDTSLEDILESVTDLGEFAAFTFTALAVVFGVVTAAVLLVVGAVAAVIAIFGLALVAIFQISAAVTEVFIAAWEGAADFLEGVDLAQLGTDLILGLAKGIQNAAGAVVRAMTGVVGGAISSAKSLLGIASPSKVFAEVGSDTGVGFAEGIEDTVPMAQTALEALVEPPDARAPGPPAIAPAPSADPSGGSGAGTNITGNTFIFQGVADAEDAEQRFGEMLIRILEGDVTQLGSAPAT